MSTETHYIDRPGADFPDAAKAERAYRRGYLAGAHRAARWPVGPDRVTAEKPRAATASWLDAWQARQDDVERAIAYREHVRALATIRGGDGETYRPGHAVQAARARGYGQALAAADEFWAEWGATDAGCFAADDLIVAGLRSWAAAVARWARGPIDLSAVARPPSVDEGIGREAFNMIYEQSEERAGVTWQGDGFKHRPEPIPTGPRRVAVITCNGVPLGQPIEPAEPEPAPEPFKPFPVDVLPAVLRDFVGNAADALGCDPSFVALPLLAGCAAAVGNARTIELKRGWREPSIVWAATVGESGTLKSPALDIALRPIRERQNRAMREHKAALAQYRADVLQYEKALADWKRKGDAGFPPVEPQQPTAERVVCEDVTVEALGGLLAVNPRGLLVARDELSGWIGSFDRYASGKGGDCPAWLSLHGGRPLVVDRKGAAGPIHVARAAVSIAGGIQPATLRRVLGQQHFENGLAARLLLACPPRQAKRWSEAEVDERLESAVAATFDRLYDLEPAYGADGEPVPAVVKLTPEAKRIWVSFYNRHAAEHADLTGDLAAAWSKLEGYAARLALVVHAVRLAGGEPVEPDRADVESAKAGIALSRWFAGEAMRLYGQFHEPEERRERRELVEWIQARGGVVKAWDLQHGPARYRGRPTAEIEAALRDLAAAGLGKWEHKPIGKQGGRPSKVFTLRCT